MPRTEVPEGHRVILSFEDGVYWRLIHPEGGCDTASSCPDCEADLTLADSKRCEVCEEINVDECWLTGWFDNLEPEDLLRGEIELPIDAEWDGDYPIIHLNTTRLYQHWLDQLKEELLGDGVVEVVAKRAASRGGFTWKHTNTYYRNLFLNKARGDLRAALASIPRGEEGS